MGYFRHEAIVVTSYSEENTKEAHDLATRIFSEAAGDDEDKFVRLVSPIVTHMANGGSSFLIAPDGSKEGWTLSDIGEAKRRQFINMLTSLQNHADYALVRIGGDDDEFTVLESSGCAPQPKCGFRIGIVTIEDPDFKRDLDKYLDGVVGVIEATDCEKFFIWQEFTQNQKRVWESSGHGLMCGVGEINDMPVTLSFMTATLDGHKMLFYHSPSQVVDHRMVRTWLNENCPKSAWEGDRLRHADATNYHNAFPRKATA